MAAVYQYPCMRYPFTRLHAGNQHFAFDHERIVQFSLLNFLHKTWRRPHCEQKNNSPYHGLILRDLRLYFGLDIPSESLFQTIFILKSQKNDYNLYAIHRRIVSQLHYYIAMRLFNIMWVPDHYLRNIYRGRTFSSSAVRTCPND